VTNPYAPPKAPVADAPEIGRASVWMTRVLALFFAVYALYCCWTLLYNLSPIAIATAGIFGFAAVGLWRMRPWSRWIVYSISTVLCLYFVWYFSRAVQDGWPYDSATRAVAALVPGLLLLLFGIATAVHVSRVFRRR